VLPGVIAERRKYKDRPIADGLDDVTIVFPYIVGFTSFATRLSPDKVFSMADEVSSALDDLPGVGHGLEKIKTLCDAYMVAGGSTTPNPEHAWSVANFVPGLLQYLMQLRQGGRHDFRMREGIYTCPVVTRFTIR